MRKLKIVRWRLHNIYTQRHVMKVNNTLLCGKVYPPAFELDTRSYGLIDEIISIDVVDHVNCIDCARIFKRLVEVESRKNKTENPIILRLGI